MATTAKPSTTKPRKKSASSAGKLSASSTARAKAAGVPDSNGDGSGHKAAAIGTAVRNEAGIVANGAAAAAIGTAIAALGGRALIASRRRKRVLGVPLPHRHTTVKSIAKQVADLAGQLERKTADVSKASARAKQAAQVLS